VRRCPIARLPIDRLDDLAALLRAQEANPYRVKAWEAAARQVRSLAEPLAGIPQTEGRAGLEALPHVGRSSTSAIDELLHRGRLTLLERLRGAVSPEDLFATIPRLGAKLAERLHRELSIETLEELELAAHDGRLEGAACGCRGNSDKHGQTIACLGCELGSCWADINGEGR